MKDGHSAAIVLSTEEFEKLQYERELFDAIAQGEKELEEGYYKTLKQVFRQMRRWGAKDKKQNRKQLKIT